MSGSAGLLFLAALIAVSSAATYNRAMTSSARAAVREDKLFFSFVGVSPPRRPGVSQVLLSIAFPGHSRFVMSLDRGLGQVTLDSVANGVKETQRLPAPDVTGRTALDSLLLEVDQEERRATVYVNCHLQGSVTMPWTPREMANDGGEDLRVYHDRHVEVTLDWQASLMELLQKLDCPDDDDGDHDAHPVQAQANEVYTYRRAVRCQNLQYGEPCPTFTQPIAPPDRGDIPILHGEEASTKLIKTISELIETIKELQTEVETQREETALLRDALLNCEACKPGRDSRFGR